MAIIDLAFALEKTFKTFMLVKLTERCTFLGLILTWCQSRSSLKQLIKSVIMLRFFSFGSGWQKICIVYYFACLKLRPTQQTWAGPWKTFRTTAFNHDENEGLQFISFNFFYNANVSDIKRQLKINWPFYLRHVKSFLKFCLFLLFE